MLDGNEMGRVVVRKVMGKVVNERKRRLRREEWIGTTRVGRTVEAEDASLDWAIWARRGFVPSHRGTRVGSV